jgi:hypothetical protein
MRGIAEWLASIGLSEYAQPFAENAIDLSVVRDLTEQDLKDLEVLLGHRRKILRAIAELDGVAPAPTETATEPAPRDEAERRHPTWSLCGDDAGRPHNLLPNLPTSMFILPLLRSVAT